MDTQEENTVTLAFPEPGALEGGKSRPKASSRWKIPLPHTQATRSQLRRTSPSRGKSGGVSGKKGEGKSSAVKLLSGENIPQNGSGGRSCVQRATS